MIAGTIFVIDDNPDNLSLLASILRERGYQIRVATTGRWALEAIRKSPPDLIMLDMLLSGADGRELTRKLKGQETTARIPVLMISAHPRAEQEALAAGADGFLAKPFSLKEILGRVETYW